MTVLLLTAPPTWAAGGWANERCSGANGSEPQSMGLSMSAGGAANPKLACCIYGWNEAAVGSSKKDCIQTPDFPTFEALYNDPGSSNPTLSDSLTRPNRVFIIDSVTLKPIPGFYTPDGLRCGYLAAKTIKQQFDLFDSAATNKTVPTADVPSNCTRLVRVAMVATCPPLSKTNLVAQQTIGPSNFIRCTAAMTIKFHIGILDLSPGSSGHLSYHTVTSYDPAAGAGKTLDFLKTNSIAFSKILQITSPGSCMSSPDLTYDSVTKKCRLN